MNYLFLAAALLLSSCCRQTASMPELIPAPCKVELKSGVYELPQTVVVALGDSLLQPAVEFLEGSLAEGTRVESRVGDSGDIVLALDHSLDTIGGYRLSVSRRGVQITAGSYGGTISAIATLGQLAAGEVPGQLPVLVIEDAPRFAWRGFMLDVSRHFFTVEEVKALLDKMARYKFNKFHWHLTDDQGWRIEIRRYPQLTAVGGWRNPTRHNHDIMCREQAAATGDASWDLPAANFRGELYGGSYTQAQIREVVAYAAKLGVDVIPELDMPGHSLKVVENFPAFSCTGRAEWGENFSTPLCLGNDATLEFCKNVYAEVFELFPFEYVHLGADEVEKNNWQQCPKCLGRIAREGLTDEHGLQTWFVGQMAAFFEASGRHLIGWDEIAGDGLPQSTVVQWWRSWMPATLVDAVQNGSKVIVSPSEFMYLSDAQNRNSLLKTYGYEPSEGLPVGAENALLGVHANLWAEQIASFDRACYQLFPRFFAASEIAWVQPERKDPSSFLRRVIPHLQRLDAEGWNYRIPDLGGFCDENVFIDSARVEILKPFDGVVVRYTTDGSLPNAASAVYERPIVVTTDCTLRLRSYTASGKPGDVVEARYRSGAFHDAVSVGGPLSEGLVVRWYDFQGKSCRKIETAPLNGEYQTPGVEIPAAAKGNIGLVFSGYVDIPADGIYSFYTYSDDGSTLAIDGITVVDNDGPHPRTERSGQLALRKGLHRLEVRYFDSDGGILEAGLIDPTGLRTPFGGEQLKHKPGGE